jgi:hypothetical protein
MSRNQSVSFSILGIFLILSACGGGGGGFSGDQAFGVLWDGSWDVDGSPGSNTTAIGISTDGGKFQLLLLEADEFDPDLLTPIVQISGTAVVDLDQVSGEGLAYTLQPGDSFPGGATVTEFSFMGTLSQRNSLEGSWVINPEQPADSQTGDFNFTYDSDHERDSSLALLNGSWLPFDFSGAPAGPAFNIMSGMVFRQTAACTSSATITVPDSKFNVYEWVADIQTTDAIPCPVAGQYSGLAALGDSGDAEPQLNDALAVLLSNANRAIPLLLLREP